jgi:hypothetical protein
VRICMKRSKKHKSAMLTDMSNNFEVAVGNRR